MIPDMCLKMLFHSYYYVGIFILINQFHSSYGRVTDGSFISQQNQLNRVSKTTQSVPVRTFVVGSRDGRYLVIRPIHNVKVSPNIGQQVTSQHLGNVDTTVQRPASMSLPSANILMWLNRFRQQLAKGNSGIAGTGRQQQTNAGPLSDIYLSLIAGNMPGPTKQFGNAASVLQKPVFTGSKPMSNVISGNMPGSTEQFGNAASVIQEPAFSGSKPLATVISGNTLGLRKQFGNAGSVIQKTALARSTPMATVIAGNIPGPMKQFGITASVVHKPGLPESKPTATVDGAALLKGNEINNVKVTGTAGKSTHKDKATNAEPNVLIKSKHDVGIYSNTSSSNNKANNVAANVAEPALKSSAVLSNERLGASHVGAMKPANTVGITVQGADPSLSLAGPNRKVPSSSGGVVAGEGLQSAISSEAAANAEEAAAEATERNNNGTSVKPGTNTIGAQIGHNSASTMKHHVTSIIQRQPTLLPALLAATAFLQRNFGAVVTAVPFGAGAVISTATSAEAAEEAAAEAAEIAVESRTVAQSAALHKPPNKNSKVIADRSLVSVGTDGSISTDARGSITALHSVVPQKTAISSEAAANAEEAAAEAAEATEGRTVAQPVASVNGTNTQQDTTSTPHMIKTVIPTPTETSGTAHGVAISGV